MTSTEHGATEKEKKNEKKNRESKKKKLHTRAHVHNPYVNAFELRPICYPESHYPRSSTATRPTIVPATTTVMFICI